MDPLLVVLIGVPVVWHLAAVTGVHWDAGRVGMPRPEWTLVAAFVPLFGLFAYLLERSERLADSDDDPYDGSTYNVHESVRGRGDGEGSDPGHGGDR
jgi:hypothetical protein